jgi:hypothetical protein
MNNAVFWELLLSTRRHIQEEGIFHSHRRENLKP